jgi:acetyl esterase
MRWSPWGTPPPEHVFPAPVEDALAMTRAALAGQVPGTDPQRVAVAGSSAGGNLAAVVTQQLRREPGLRHQVLIYPVTRGHVPNTGTFAHYADGHFRDRARHGLLVPHLCARGAGR